MFAMQYTINLPTDYDMNILRKRVQSNGYKTDGFQDLFLKAYLISEQSEQDGSRNSYCPLYLWQEQEGMNQFLFDGFYDNILASFGWQQIQLFIPLKQEWKTDFAEAVYAVRYKIQIQPAHHMTQPTFSHTTDTSLGSLLLYDPTQWICVEYHFYKEKPVLMDDACLFEILHLSVS